MANSPNNPTPRDPKPANGGGGGIPPIDQLQGRPIGRVLTKMGKITRDQYLEALSFQKQKGGLLGRLVQMALIAARRSHAPDPSQRLAVAIGTGLGCLEDAGVFLENLISKDEREPMPARFPNSVHNAPAAQIAIDQNACAMNSAPTMGEISFESALWQGIRQLEIGEADCALVGAVDELNKYPLAIGSRWGLWDEKTIPGEGAMIASLTRTENSATPLARVTAVRLGQ